jgi:hypothetical protein
MQTANLDRIKASALAARPARGRDHYARVWAAIRADDGRDWRELTARRPVGTLADALAGRAVHIPRLVLVACVSQKLETPAPARDLYISDWFRKARRFAESTGAPWAILSARHGIIAPDAVVAPYSETIASGQGATRRRAAWSRLVAAQMPHATFGELVVVAGRHYRESLGAVLGRAERVEYPLAGSRGLGDQKHRLAVAAAAATH